MTTHYFYLLLVLFIFIRCTPVSGSGLVAVTPIPAGTTLEAPLPRLSPPTAQELPPTNLPTPAPLPRGQAYVIARATDTVLVPEQATTLTFDDDEPTPITFEEFYDGYEMRTGLILSEKLVALDGKPVVIEGYMAPPLMPQFDFFVLTLERLSFCPFCSSAAEWPNDIALVYILDNSTSSTLKPIRVYGQMEIGPLQDPKTGMFSLVRIYAHTIEIME